MNSAKVPIIHMDMYVRPQDDPSMLKRTKAAFLVALILIPLGARGQNQASVAVFPVGTLSRGDQWIAMSVSSELVEKLIRTSNLRPVHADYVQDRLDKVLGPKSMGPAWLPASVQQKVGQWLDADLIITGLVGSTRNRHQARAFLDGLSIVPSVTPEGSEAWMAAKLIDVHRGKSVSWAFSEGSRDGFFELQDALYLQIVASLGLDPGGMAPGTVGRRPTESRRAYQLTQEAESLLSETVKQKHLYRQRKKARRKLEQSLKMEPTYAKTYALLGHVAEVRGDTQMAFDYYGQASALDPNYVAPRFAIANLANLDGDTSGEIAALQSVLEAVPWHDDAYDQLGLVHERLGQSELAATYYDRALGLSDVDPDRLYRASSVHLSLGQFDRAVDYLGRAVARIPGEQAYHVGLTRAYTRAGDFELAKDALAAAHEVGVESTDLWLAAGELALKTKDYAEAEAAFNRVLAEQPGRTDAQLMVARLRSARGDYQAAIEAYTQAIEGGLQIEDVLEPLASAYIGVGDQAKADQLYKDALTKRPNEISWLMARSRILIGTLAHTDAIPLLRRVLAKESNNLDAHEWIAGAYAAVANDHQALDHYRRVIGLDPGRSYVYTRMGDLHYGMRDFQDARKTYKMAIDRGVRTAEAYAGLGLAEEELSRYRNARTAYRRARDRDPGNEIARKGLQRMRSKIRPPRRQPTASESADRGRRMMESDDLEGALSAFLYSLDRDAANSSVLVDIGTVYARLGDTQSARSAFESAERLKPTPKSAYNLGRLSYQEGKASEAMLNYQIALQRDETFLRASINLAAIQAGTNDPLSAISTLQAARRHHPQNGAVLVSLANAQFQAGDLDQAAAFYESSRSLPNALADAEIGLGNVALAQGDTVSASSHYQAAITASPDNPNPRVNLGTVLIQQGQFDKAVVEFEKALALSPGDIALYLNLAVLYYHTEQYPEALEYCRSILEQDASYVEPQRLIADIALAKSEHEIAVEAYGVVLQQQPGDLASLLGMAEALSGLEQMEEAQEYWQEWLDTVGDDPAYATQAEALVRRVGASDSQLRLSQ